MRPLILEVSVMSLDGFIAAEDTGTDEFSNVHDAELGQWIVGSISGVDTHIMGSITYLSMAEHWPNSTEIFAPPMNSIPKVVFSKSLQQAMWTDFTIASGDIVDEIRRLKSQPGNFIMAHGAIKFLQSLTKLDVVDEYRLLVYLYVAGSGSALFGGVQQLGGLKLKSSRQFDSAVMALVYQPTRSH